MKIRLDLKVFVLLILFYFTKQIQIYFLLMLFALIHELGHMVIGMLVGFKPTSISIMPIGMRIDFNIDEVEYNKKIKNGSKLNLKKIIISLAGPLTNITIAMLALITKIEYMEVIIYANLLLAIFNIIPIYPLDGGRILKNVLNIFIGKYKSIKYTNRISNIVICVLTMVSSIVILQFKNVFILLILAYLWYLVIKQNKKSNLQIKALETIERVESNNWKKLSI